MIEELSRFLGQQRRSAALRPSTADLSVELLEDRSLPSASLISNINSSGSSLPQELVNFGGYVYFTADDGVHGRELWRTDGTAAGTVLVYDINPGTAGSNPQFLTPVGSWLYFTAFRPDVGTELWRTDGVVVQLLGDLNPGTTSSNPTHLTAVNDTLFFTATHSATGSELWKATSAGVSFLADLVPGSASSSPRELTNVSGILFFSAWTPTYGRELWKSDGTAGGTQLVADINQVVPVPPLSSNNLDSDPRYLVNVNGVLYFSANDGLSGNELWKSDGTSTGTLMVADIVPGANGSFPAWLTNVNGTLFFTATSSGQGRELWRSHGTSASTLLVRDIRPASDSSYPQSLVSAGGLLYFTANDGTHGLEIWRSDGTSSGTLLLRDIRPGSLSSYPSALRELNGGIVFVADDGTNGAELWRSLGQTSNTVLLDDVLAGSAGSAPNELTNYQGKLIFRASDSTGDIELYFLDTSTTNIVQVVRPSAKLYKLGDHLDFRVIFNNIVTVDTSGGTPAIALRIGSRTRLATYLSGSGTDTLVFRYTVRSDDEDRDGITVLSPIFLRGGHIIGPVNTTPSLTFTPPDASSVRVDGIAPRITSIQGPRPGTYHFRDRLRFFVFTNEPVYWKQPGGRPYLEIIIGGEVRQAGLITGSGTRRLVFEYRIERGDNAPSGIWIRERIFLNGSRLVDAAGNLLYLNFVPPNLRRVRVAT